jgi:hypothetical protein
MDRTDRLRNSVAVENDAVIAGLCRFRYAPRLIVKFAPLAILAIE